MAENWAQGENVCKKEIHLTSCKVAELLCCGMQAVVIVSKYTNTKSTCQHILRENAGQGLLVCILFQNKPSHLWCKAGQRGGESPIKTPPN
jgi:hypothetical protein